MEFRLLLLLLLNGITASLWAQPRPTTAPVRLILDTDIGPDYDDVGAITLLHALADSGQVEILATIGSNQSPYVAPVLDVMNTYFGRPELPVGVVRGQAVNLPAEQKWDSLLVADYPHDLATNRQAEDATALYRRLLAAQPDSSVTIVTVGFLTNLANLLESGPDPHSPLDGVALVRKKVKKLVAMAGHFGSKMGVSVEFNIRSDALAAKFTFDHWPGLIVFGGYEIGAKVFTGLLLANSSARSPGRDAYARAIRLNKNNANGRMSFDQTAVLVAVKGYEPYYSLVEGRMETRADGLNNWDSSGKGHFYLVEKMPPKQVAAIIDKLMLHQPFKP